MCRGLLQSRKSPRSNFIVHYRARRPRSNRYNLRTPIAASARHVPRLTSTATTSALQSQRPFQRVQRPALHRAFSGIVQPLQPPRSNRSGHSNAFSDPRSIFSVRYSACGDLDPTATTRLRLSASGTVLNSAQLAVGRDAQASLRFKPPCSFSRQVTIASSYAMLPFVVTRDAGPGIGLARNFWSKRTQPKTLRQPFANRYRGTYRCLIRSPILPSLSRTERPSARSPANAETSIHH